LTKPRLGELVAALCGLGLLAVSLLPWYEAGSAGVELTAWEAFDVIDVVMMLPVACAVLVACLDWFRLSASLPVPGSATTALFATFAFLLVAYRALNPPGEGLEREPALYAGLALLGGILGGSIVGMYEETPPRALAATR
jgi:hypothetical protein